nr:MAG TPA: hypothetical protein [Caudoviricetes sp.]
MAAPALRRGVRPSFGAENTNDSPAGRRERPESEERRTTA